MRIPFLNKRIDAGSACISFLIGYPFSEDTPSALKYRCNSLRHVGYLIMILGAATAVIMADGITAVMFFGLAALAGIALMIMALSVGHTVYHEKYNTFYGTCQNYHYLIETLGVQAKPDGFILDCNDMILFVPASKKSVFPAIGSRVAAYIPSSASFYEKSGVRRYDAFLGYELVPEGKA